MPCRVPKRRFSCGAPQHLTKNLKKAKVSALIPRAVSPMAAKPLEQERWQPICNIKKDLLSVSVMTNGKGRS